MYVYLLRRVDRFHTHQGPVAEIGEDAPIDRCRREKDVAGIAEGVA